VPPGGQVLTRKDRSSFSAPGETKKGRTLRGPSLSAHNSTYVLGRQGEGGEEKDKDKDKDKDLSIKRKTF
jgi:hypothetical protein